MKAKKHFQVFRFTIPLWWPDRNTLHRLLPSPGNIVVALLIVALLWAQSAGALPLRAPASAPTSTGTIAYQGRLADAAGTPLTSIYPMIFRLYNSAGAGATPLWEEQWTGPNSVQVRDGLFNVMLGSLTPIPQNVVTGNDTLWLGITVGTDDEMSPRVQLGSVPFAVQANTVPNDSITTQKIANSTIQAEDLAPDAVPPGVPVGTVISWWRPDAGTPLPSDEWAVADGSTVTDPESPLYGRALPNLTDRFIMGVAPGNIGTAGGANVLNLAHSHTVGPHRHLVDSHGHSIPDHSHSISGETTEVYAMWDGGHYNSGGESYRYAMNTYQTTWYTRHNHRVNLNSGGWSGNTGNTSPYTDYQSPGTDSQLSGATDNRPAYVGLLYLVRIK